MKTKKANNFNTIKRLVKIIVKENKISLLIVFISIIISAVANVTSPVFIGKIIDNYIIPLLNPDLTYKDFSGLDRVILVMALIFLIGVITNYIYNTLMVDISQKTLKKIRDKMFDRMEKLPIRYFDNNSRGDIMSHYTSDIDSLEQMISQSMPQFINSTISIITILIAMIALSKILTLIILVFAFIMVLVTKFLTKNSSKYFKRQQEDIGDLNGYIEEMIAGQKVVKVFNYEDRTEKEFDKLNDKLFVSMNNAHKYANTLMPVLTNVGNIEYIVVALVGAFLAINGKVSGLTVGVIVSFLTLTKSFNQPIKQLSQQVNSIVLAIAGAGRIFELIDEEEEVDDGYVTLVNVKKSDGKLMEVPEYTGHWAFKVSKDGIDELHELKGHIVFDNVTFGYIKGKLALKNVSLYANPDEKVAFVGATGAGKTTITNLLNRFYDIDNGKITYDGIDIKLIKKKDLRKSLGMVLQDTTLFTGTIEENIRYGNLKASFDDVVKAAKIANADDFIMKLPNGYKTVITGNGSNLSQGERQLLAIARCAISNPPVMILDEATSSIDTYTEKLVQSGLDNLMDGRTVFVIAHRLSTIQNSQVIMVLDHGEIIERGDHETLIDKKGEYYKLYTGSINLE